MPYGEAKICSGHDCKQAADFGWLCPDHQVAVATDVAQDLSSAGSGVLPQHLRVVVNENLYVHAADMRVRPLAYQPVHRMVMQRVLDRPLTYTESVHHVNGCKWDNSASNLELWVTSQPPGQRPDDLATYARRLLARYGTSDEHERYCAR